MSAQAEFDAVKVTTPAEMRSFVFSHLPDGTFRRVCVKPNWVKHQENPAFPISALVTSSALIDAVLEACLEKYPGLEEVTVGDVPLQSCDWEMLLQQAGIDRLIAKYEKYRAPQIRFRDLRRERFRLESGFLMSTHGNGFGDLRGYQEVRLDVGSYLEEISDDRGRFRVSDYNPEETASSHRKGFHRYLIARTALECDLFINLPKMKTHQKAGITGALKNLVGINGNKAFLVHHRQGCGDGDSDEFAPASGRLIPLQTRIRELAQGRSRFAFSLLRPGWRALKRVAGIHTEGTPGNLEKNFYVGSGSWYGNDTVWRMIYDLNLIIRQARAHAETLSDTVEREYLALLDGMVAGEGNGPLQPLPVQTGIVAACSDPFLMDTVMARLMGFSPEKMPVLARRTAFSDPAWGHFDAENVVVRIGPQTYSGLASVPVMHPFRPAPGWKNHIELDAAASVA